MGFILIKIPQDEWEDLSTLDQIYGCMVNSKYFSIFTKLIRRPPGHRIHVTYRDGSMAHNMEPLVPSSI